jgi:nucleoside-diphosphate-sugar epimerase
MQGFFYTFPELDEYSNKDLYKPHPELEDHWFYYGRADNIIVFSNGEKLNPVTIEEMVQDHEEVKGVLVVGTNRFQPALLLEPSTHPKDEKEGYEFVENIWPLVEKANHETVFHGRIGKEFIMLSNPNKPFIRTAKGNVQRAGTSKLYADEIDQLYLKAEEGTHLEIPALDISSEEGLINSIIKMLERNVQAQQGIMEKDTDFFSLGIDSLQIMTTSRLLRAALNTSGYITDTNSMSPRIIYHNPTPRRLAQYILHSIIHHGTKRDDNEDSEIQLMQNLYSKYTRDLPTSPSRPPPSSTSQTVILTGSTGTLGSHLLHNLLLSPSISHIHCLNRASDGGAAQQTKSMTLRGLANPDDFPQKKIEFHHFNVGMERLGLEDDDVYERLRRETDRIIHNAWAVNYLLTTASFEVHLGGARSLADFAASAERRAGLVFISSVATCARWDPGRGSVPERRLEDFTLPSNGYGRSKFLASLILDEVSRSGDFPLSVIRVGQIAGPEKAGDAGEWNRNEWLPSIISSSLYLGVLPKDLGPLSRVDWTPVERIAGMVLEIGGMSPDFDGGDGGVVGEEGGYFHGVNPRTIQWDLLARVVMDFYGDRIKELIPFREWIERLEASSLENETEWGGVEDRNPGIKLLDTYKGMLKDGEEGKESVVFGMEKTLKRSGVMREGGAITGEMMRGWCRQWDF